MPDFFFSTQDYRAVNLPDIFFDLLLEIGINMICLIGIRPGTNLHKQVMYEPCQNRSILRTVSFSVS